MNILDEVAHAVLSVLSIFVRWLLAALDVVEGAFRLLLGGSGLGAEVQTVLLLIMLVLFLLGVVRLLRGRVRGSATLVLVLVLAHTLEHIARGP